MYLPLYYLICPAGHNRDVPFTGNQLSNTLLRLMQLEEFASRASWVMRAAQLGVALFLATILLLAAPLAMTSAHEAHAETRSLKLYYVHTRERKTITYKKNGKFLSSGLKELNYFLRDWRRNEPTKMDPRLFDLIWEAYRRTGSNEYIHVLSAYRAPETNSMLRSRSKAVAKNSQHILGKAMDFYIPGVKLQTLREIGLKMQIGGVGYYPRSGSPFVHLDVGGVRAWPRADRQTLARLFPDGKTLHIPPDGKPLPGYQAALADYKKRIGATSITVADSGGGSKKRKNILALLFGGGDEDESPEAIASSQKTLFGSTSKKDEPKAAPAAKPPVAVATATQLPGVETFAPPVPDSRPRRTLFGNSEGAVVETALVSPEPEPASQAIDALLPADGAPVPEEAFVDLAQYQVPLPELLGQRRLPGEAEAATDEIAIAAAEITAVPELRAPADADNNEQQLAAALLPDAEAAAANENAGLSEKVAAANDELASLLQDLAKSQENTTSEPATFEVAALPTPAVRPANDQPITRSLSGQLEKAAESFDPAPVFVKPTAAPRKGNRPRPTDAAAAAPSAVLTKPKLTKDMLAQWALSNGKSATLSKPVKAPRFVSRQMRAQPEAVYDVGFETQTAQVNPSRFSGSAVNFLKVRKFEE